MLIEVTEDEFFVEHKDHNRDPSDYQPATDIKIPKAILKTIESAIGYHDNHEYDKSHKIYFIMHNYYGGNHMVAITQGLYCFWIRSESLNFTLGELKKFYKCDIFGLKEYLSVGYKKDHLQ